MNLSPSNESILEMEKAIECLPHPDYVKWSIGVLRNITIEPIETALKYVGLDLKLNTEVQFGAYDQILQDAIEEHGLLKKNSFDLLIVMQYLPTQSPILSHSVPQHQDDKIIQECELIKSQNEYLYQSIRRNHEGYLIWFQYEQVIDASEGIYDAYKNNGQQACIDQLNYHIDDLLKDEERSYCIPRDRVLRSLGEEQYYDLRYWHMNKAPYSFNALHGFAKELKKYWRPFCNQTKKCLILDCDNILWGGILGEKGIDHIALGPNHPGSSYMEFQEQIVNLYHRGIILALCSKNDEELVWNVFDKHPHMVLKKEHIAATRINWNDKGSNIKALANELNIGLDSFVFIDDSIHEIEWVKQHCPEVTSLHFNEKDSKLFYRNLLKLDYFETCHISEEDRKRGDLYRAEVSRKKSQAETSDLNTYLQSLEMELDIERMNKASASRSAQLCQKTNQFNCTTKRYREDELLKKSEAGDLIYTLKVKDRYGDSGLVGLAILELNNGEATMDTFLMSCRVLGRKIEQTFLFKLIQTAREKGIGSIHGLYQATERNQQVNNFYLNNQFKKTSNGDVQHFCLEADKLPLVEEGLFKRISINDHMEG